MSPTIYGSAESLATHSITHVKPRGRGSLGATPHTFLHVDWRASARSPAINRSSRRLVTRIVLVHVGRGVATSCPSDGSGRGHLSDYRLNRVGDSGVGRIRCVIGCDMGRLARAIPGVRMTLPSLHHLTRIFPAVDVPIVSLAACFPWLRILLDMTYLN
jgi:hypothetical protein